MRDPARIDRILALIRHEWQRYPDQRLGQLLANMTGREFFDGEFGAEDSEIEAAMRRQMGADEAETQAMLAEDERRAVQGWADFNAWMESQMRDPNSELRRIIGKTGRRK